MPQEQFNGLGVLLLKWNLPHAITFFRLECFAAILLPRYDWPFIPGTYKFLLDSEVAHGNNGLKGSLNGVTGIWPAQASWHTEQLFGRYPGWAV